MVITSVPRRRRGASGVTTSVDHRNRGCQAARQQRTGLPLSYPLNPVVLIPWIRYLLKNRKIKKTGSSDSVDMANIGP